MVSRIKIYASMQILLFSLLGIFPIASQAEIMVIAHKSLSVDSISIKQAKKLWLGRLKKLGGTRVKVIDQTTGNKAFETFYASVIKKKPSQLEAYWAKIAFTGKGYPPKQLKDDAAVINWVANNPSALGYVDSSAVNDTVKPLLTAK